MVYLDNAATTKMTERVINATQSAFSDYYNPSSIYPEGFDIKNKIKLCQNKISTILNCEPDEIFFTSGGTESDNWAIKGLLNHAKKTNKNIIITSSFEHHAIIRTLESLDSSFFNIIYVDPDKDGIIDYQVIEEIIDQYKEKVLLCSIMMVNNVIGTIQPIRKISEICHQYNIIVHTDAVQAIGNIKIDIKDLNVDMLSASAHKFHGPKGIGFLYVKTNTPLDPLIYGGGQQNGMRSGTDNYPLIKGMTTALEETYENFGYKWETKYGLRKKLFKELSRFSEIKYNGMSFKKIVSNVNVSFKDITSDILVNLMGKEGYQISVGSACDTGDLEDSYVLKSINQPKEFMDGMIRITFNETNTDEELENFVNTLEKYIVEMRGYL